MDILSCLKLLAQTLSISLCSDCLLWLLWFGFWKFDFNMLDDILRGISHNVIQKTVGRKFFVKICQSQGNKMIYNVTHFQSTSYQYAVEIWQSNLEMTALWDKQLNSTELQQSYQILLGTVIGKFFFFQISQHWSVKRSNTSPLVTNQCNIWCIRRGISIHPLTPKSDWHLLSPYNMKNMHTVVNPLTPKIWLLILPSGCYTFPCKLVMRTWC